MASGYVFESYTYVADATLSATGKHFPTVKHKTTLKSGDATLDDLLAKQAKLYKLAKLEAKYNKEFEQAYADVKTAGYEKVLTTAISKDFSTSSAPKEAKVKAAIDLAVKHAEDKGYEEKKGIFKNWLAENYSKILQNSDFIKFKETIKLDDVNVKAFSDVLELNNLKDSLTSVALDKAVEVKHTKLGTDFATVFKTLTSSKAGIDVVNMIGVEATGRTNSAPSDKDKLASYAKVDSTQDILFIEDTSLDFLAGATELKEADIEI